MFITATSSNCPIIKHTNLFCSPQQLCIVCITIGPVKCHYFVISKFSKNLGVVLNMITPYITIRDFAVLFLVRSFVLVIVLSINLVLVYSMLKVAYFKF